MANSKNSSIRVGLSLILLGGLFLAVQIIPSFSALFSGQNAPALVLFGIALVLALIGIATASPGMAVPVCILAGIGGIFYWQVNADLGFTSWSYMWTLIPGFVGVGIFLSELLQGKPLDGIWNATGPIAVSAVLFFIFASAFGQFTLIGPYLPILLVVLGLFLMLRPLFRRPGPPQA
jgi:hypothetical protein